MTPYELLRRAIEPLTPALEGEVRAVLAEAVPSGAALLDVGGRKSPYTIGLPVSVTISELPRETEWQQRLHLGLDDAGVATIGRTRSNVAGVVFDDMSCSALETGSFDSAVAVEVIEHVDDDEGFVRNLARVVRRGGAVVLTTPNGDARPVPQGDHRRHYQRAQLLKLVTPYFDVVYIRYAVAMTDNRLLGLRSFSPRHPQKMFETTVANVRNRTESGDVGVRRSPGGAANLLALLRSKGPVVAQPGRPRRVGAGDLTPKSEPVMWRRRGEWVHRVVGGDAMLAAAGGERRTLQGLAAAIWMVLDEPLSLDGLAGELRSLGGGPAPEPDAIADALRLLEDHDVVEGCEL